MVLNQGVFCIQENYIIDGLYSHSVRSDCSSEQCLAFRNGRLMYCKVNDVYKRLVVNKHMNRIQSRIGVEDGLRSIY